jgi:biotin transport system ATP-binding protein
VEKLKADGMTIVILTHELEKCMGLADRFIVLDKGKLVFDGDCAKALEAELETWGIRNPDRNGNPKDLVWR